MGYGYGVDSVLRRLGEPTGDIARFCFEEVARSVRNTPAYQLLAALSLFSREASRESLGYVADLPVWERDEALVLLEKLSLVNRKEDEFRALPLTRKYILQDLELGESGLNYWDFLLQNGTRLVEVMLEAGNLRSQADFALWEVAWKLILCGDYSTSREMIEQIESIAASQRLGEVQADAWFLLALLHREMKDYKQSLQWFDRAEHFFRAQNMVSALAGLLNRKADALRKTGDFEGAKRCIGEALNLLDTSTIEPQRRLRQKTFLLGDLGAVLSREAHYEEAKKYIDQCITNLESLPKLFKQDRLMACAYIEKAVVTYHLQGIVNANEWALRAQKRIERSGIKRPISDGDEEWLQIIQEQEELSKRSA